MFETETMPNSSLATDLLKICQQEGIHIACAESCTGGGIGSTLTAISGASSVFEGGIIAYQNRVKTALLGVSEALLGAHGAVSSECALAMAQGVCHVLHATLGLAVTGIAGPGGGTSEKPVGLVFMAVCLNDQTHVIKRIFKGDRASVRQQTIHTVIALALQLVKERATK